MDAKRVVEAIELAKARARKIVGSTSVEPAQREAAGSKPRKHAPSAGGGPAVTPGAGTRKSP